MVLRGIIAAILLVPVVVPATAQGLLPVKIYNEIKSFRGNPSVVVAATDTARYTLVSAHKEMQRPWADAIFRRETADGVTYLSRGYDCAAGTWRWLGEADQIAKLSLSVTSLAQARDRAVQPGTLEYLLARYACAL